MTPTPIDAAAFVPQGAPAAEGAKEVVVNTPEQWLVAAGAAVAAMLVLGLLRWLVARRVGAWLAARPTREEMLARLHGRKRVILKTPAATVIREARDSA